MCDYGLVVSLCMQDSKCLCTAVRTCATLVVPKFDSYILNLTLKSMSNPSLLCIHVGCTHDANCIDTVHKYYCDCLKPTKVGQGDLLFACNQDSPVAQCMQDYKYLCTAVTICATLFILKFDCPFWPLWPWKVGQTQVCCTMLGTPTIQIWWP